MKNEKETTVRLSQKEERELSEMSEKTGRPVTQLMRAAILRLIEDYEENPKAVVRCLYR